MGQFVINANSRDVKGKEAAKRLRAQGRIPAVMYNAKGEATMLDVDEIEFNKVWRTVTPTTMVTVSVAGANHNVLIKDTEYNIRTDKVLHADFFEPSETESIVVKMKVHYKGTPAGVLKGGFLLKHEPQLKLKAIAKDLPETIEIDISNVNIGEVLSVKDVNLGDKITVLTPADAALVSVSAAR